MKKILTFLSAILVTVAVKAQDHGSFYDGEEIFRVSATIAVIVAFMVFIIMILRGIWDHRLKSKIVNRGISDALASSLLQDTKAGKDNNVKWFGLLAGTGIGLLIVNSTRPLGIHSLAIMVLSISVSFLGYFFYLKFSGK